MFRIVKSIYVNMIIFELHVSRCWIDQQIRTWEVVFKTWLKPLFRTRVEKGKQIKG